MKLWKLIISAALVIIGTQSFAADQTPSFKWKTGKIVIGDNIGTKSHENRHEVIQKSARKTGFWLYSIFSAYNHDGPAL